LMENRDDWDTAQRFHFAVCLAFAGNEEAKRAMYANYNPGPRYGELIGVDFLELGGIEALLFVAEKIGALLREKPGEVDCGYLLSRSLDICGEQATWDALRQAGAKNPSIEKYKSVAEESQRRTVGPSKPKDFASLTYDQLFSEWPGNKPYLLWKWGEQASDQELKSAAKGLIAAKDSKHQLAHLRIFARRRFPLDVRALLALVDIEENRVGFAAMKALTHVADPAVRTLAFRLIDNRAMCRGEAIDLLVQNYEPGDHRIVLRWFQEEEDLEARHSMGSGLIVFWKRHPDEGTEVEMMRSLYEQGPCSVCREKAVKRLLERGALSDELRAECAWDANSDIRDLVNPTVAPLP